MIDERAVIHSQASIDEDVVVGPWSVIGADVEIGPRTWIGPHVVINGPTKIGADNKIFQFASVGADPQDKKYRGERTYLELGDGNVVREYVTLNRGTQQGGGVTRIGNDNLFMAYVHIAHDCIVGDHTIFANNASLAGHVTIHDYAILSGFAGIHQFCHVGEYSFVAKGSLVTKDVPPYCLVAGVEKASAHGINVEGLKRNGFSTAAIEGLRRAYKIVYRKGLILQEAIEQLEAMVDDVPEIQLFIQFLRQSERGIVR